MVPTILTLKTRDWRLDLLKYNSLTTQDGGFVPECIRRPEIGLDLEIFNANAAADIQERMANFNELHFYDGTLSTNLTLEEAHVKIGFMLKVSFNFYFFLQF